MSELFYDATPKDQQEIHVKGHEYYDRNGELRYTCHRYWPKRFRMQQANGEWNMQGVARIPYRLPELQGKEEVFITEGEKDADELARVGLPATTNIGGAGNWTAQLSQQLHAIGVRRVVIVPDNDEKGLSHAGDVAAKCAAAGVEARIVRLPGLDLKEDVSDWVAAGNTADDLQKLAREAAPFSHSEQQEPAPGQTKPRAKRFVRADALIASPPRPSILESMAFEGGITMLVGTSGVGKTFVALSMAAAVNDGRDWCGRRAMLGSVAYVSFERDDLSVRLKGIQDAQQIPTSNIYVLPATEAISPSRSNAQDTPSRGEQELSEALDDLVADLADRNAPPLRLLVIDTLRVSLIGSEDDSDTIASYVRVIHRLLKRVPHAAAMLLHHAGWQDGENKRPRERGSSALRGNVDGTLFLDVVRTRQQQQGYSSIVLKPLKLRDAAPFDPIRLALKPVTIHATTEERATCIVELDASVTATAGGVACNGLEWRVLELLAAKPTALTKAALQGQLGVNSAKLTTVLNDLCARGWVLHQGIRQGYEITPLGRQQLTVEKLAA